MYRDKDKQREAVREATRRWRVSRVSQGGGGITVIPLGVGGVKAARGDVAPKEKVQVLPDTPIIKTKAEAVVAVGKLNGKSLTAYRVRMANGRWSCCKRYDCNCVVVE